MNLVTEAPNYTYGKNRTLARMAALQGRPMVGPTDSAAPSWTKGSMCSFWKGRSLRSKLGATKNGCGENASAAPWRFQSKNFGLWNGCWQTKVTDLVPRPEIWICS